MLQFATTSDKRYSTPEQVKLALKGGCTWVRLSGPVEATDAEAAVRDCTEAGAILIIDDDIALVDKLRVHGVHLTSWNRGSVIAARESLGPHAIIGVTCPDAASVEELRGLDVDYATFPLPPSRDPLSYYAEVVKAVDVIRHPEYKLHPVASGAFPDDMLTRILDTGIEGFEMSESLLAAPDPVYAIEKINAILTEHIGG